MSDSSSQPPGQPADGHPPGRLTETGQARLFPCQACGADLKFHIGLQSLSCEFCGHQQDIQHRDDAVVEQDFQQMLQRLQQQRQERKRQADRAQAAGGVSDNGAATGQRAAEHLQQEVRCESCGGNVEFYGTLTSTSCPYCGVPMQLEHAHQADSQRIPVDAMLPFLVDRQRAGVQLGEWLESRWFAPGDFRHGAQQGHFNGVYLSYFTFDSLTYTVWSGQRGDHYYVTVGSGKDERRERRTSWRPVSGRFQRFFDDVLILANSGLQRSYLQALEPWPLSQVVPFNQQLLAGLLSRTYDIELDECFAEARGKIDAELQADVRNRIGGDEQHITALKSQYDAITFKHLLLPVWLMAYRYNGKSYQVFINACTGQVSGERPWSLPKILLTILIVIVVIAGLFMYSNRSATGGGSEIRINQTAP
jgi:predicted RNA-binding Zn-ribbon protein involved in translation (DUF1610 family)